MQNALPIEVTKKIGKQKRGRKPKIKKQIDHEDSDQSQESTEKLNNQLVSLPRYLRHPEEYQFLEVPVIVPTLEELKFPFKLIKRLHEEGYMKHGVVKLRPDPSMWNPQYQFDKNKKLMTSRIQVVNDLSKGKPFEQNVDEYTYDEFKHQAESYEDEYQYQATQYVDIQDYHRKNEYEYFSVLENPEKFKDIEIEYAADLPSTKFGSAFEQHQQTDLNESAWNLANINKQRNSLFQFVDIQKGSQLSGITNPWIYLGMKFATFCFHTEDLWMYALNYLHQGEKKTWYTVPPQFKSKFEEVYRAKYAKIFQQKPDVMYRLNLQLCPVEATRAYIPMYRTEQAPGEFIMTFPKVYHGGFSHGFNCGEAVNIATTEWFKYYREAVEDYALKGHHKKVSFPIEWMILQIILTLDKSEFDISELEAIKQEWEEIVDKEIKNRYNVIQCYQNNLYIHPFDNKKIKYDRLKCKSCQSYMFLSYIYCNKCLKQCCTWHGSPCSCLNNKVSLFTRFYDNEMTDYTKIIDNKIQQLKNLQSQKKSKN